MPRAKSLIEIFNVKWLGIETVIRNMNKEVGKITGRTTQGLLEAALKVKGDAVRLAPVDTGNLRSSGYVLWGDSGKVEGGEPDGSFKSNPKDKINAATQHAAVVSRQKSVRVKDPHAWIGFSAHYALAVHEDLDKKHRAGQAKFLEDALMQNQKTILSIVKSRVVG